MKHSKIKRALFLYTLLALSVVLVGYIKIQYRTLVQKAYLSKNGNQFIIAFKDQDEKIELLSYDTLEKAQIYLHEQLGLELRSSLASLEFPMEYVWIRKDLGKSILYWKFSGSDHLNRMTFVNQRDAEFFEQALKKGTYSPSPIGHSLAFFPSKGLPKQSSLVSKLMDSVHAGLSF